LRDIYSKRTKEKTNLSLEKMNDDVSEQILRQAIRILSVPCHVWLWRKYEFHQSMFADEVRFLSTFVNVTDDSGIEWQSGGAGSPYMTDRSGRYHNDEEFYDAVPWGADPKWQVCLGCGYQERMTLSLSRSKQILRSDQQVITGWCERTEAGKLWMYERTTMSHRAHNSDRWRVYAGQLCLSCHDLLTLKIRKLSKKMMFFLKDIKGSPLAKKLLLSLEHLLIYDIIMIILSFAAFWIPVELIDVANNNQPAPRELHLRKI
jgi:hypothetical protein